MKALVIILWTASVSVMALESDFEFPAFIKTCHLNDPARDQCIKEMVQTFISSTRKETPNFHIPKFEPDFVKFEFMNTDIGYDYNVNVTNMKNFGLGRTKIRSIKSNFMDGRMRVDVEAFVPKIMNIANYSLSLTTPIRFLNLQSRGKYKGILRDMNVKLIAKGKLEKFNGEDHLKVYRIDLDPDINEMELHASDEILNEISGNFRAWRVFYKDILQATKPQWEPLALMFLNRVSEQLPFWKVILKD